MKKLSRTLAAASALCVLTIGVAACSDDPTGPEPEAAALLSVQPSPGSTGVAVGSTVVVTFDHALGSGMEAYAALHEGSLTGPQVEGAWALSQDGLTLTFTPASPLKTATTYVIHLGGGMMDQQGNHVDLDAHGSMMGGQWATQSMMSGGGMGSGMGSGMGQNNEMMGEGWAHPDNGSFGMIFSFTTAG